MSDANMIRFFHNLFREGETYEPGPSLRSEFLKDPQATARRWGLTAAQIDALTGNDLGELSSLLSEEIGSIRGGREEVEAPAPWGQGRPRGCLDVQPERMRVGQPQSINIWGYGFAQFPQLNVRFEGAGTILTLSDPASYKSRSENRIVLNEFEFEVPGVYNVALGRDDQQWVYSGWRINVAG